MPWECSATTSSAMSAPGVPDLDVSVQSRLRERNIWMNFTRPARSTKNVWRNWAQTASIFFRGLIRFRTQRKEKESFVGNLKYAGIFKSYKVNKNKKRFFRGICDCNQEIVKTWHKLRSQGKACPRNAQNCGLAMVKAKEFKVFWFNQLFVQIEDARGKKAVSYLPPTNTELTEGIPTPRCKE